MKKRVLICLPSIANEDGIARVIMNYYDKVLNNKYQLDFLCVYNKNSDKYENIIKNNNGEIFYLPKSTFITRYFKTLFYIKKLNKQYDIVHINLINIYALACINGVKKYNPKIVLHAHNPRIIGRPYMKLINDFAHFLCKKNSEYFAACSNYAGKSVFGSNYTVIPNKIDVERFLFSYEDRKKIRRKYNVKEDEYLIGVIARITEQKNPVFIIKIFYELLRRENKFKLIWIGNGNLKERIIKMCSELKISDKVIFINETDCTNKYYCSMDAFLLPSSYEGLGIVFVEAQASGLRTYASTNVPQDVKITDLIKFLAPKDEKKWADSIICGRNTVPNRKKYNKEVKKSIFYNNKDRNELMEFYDFVMEGE